MVSRFDQLGLILLLLSVMLNSAVAYREHALEDAIYDNSTAKVRVELAKRRRPAIESDYYSTAIENGNLEILNMLIDCHKTWYDSSINRHARGHLALAVEKGNLDIVERLLHLGIKPDYHRLENDVINNRTQIIQKYIDHGVSPVNLLLIKKAIDNNNLDMVNVFLQDYDIKYEWEQIATLFRIADNLVHVDFKTAVLARLERYYSENRLPDRWWFDHLT